MIRAALTPPWVQMSEASLPSSWAEARDVTLANAPWIFLLLAGERAIDGHYKQAGIALLLCLVSFGVAIYWKVFTGLTKPEGRRRVAFIFIAAGALILSVGIYLLATRPIGMTPSEPLPPPAHAAAAAIPVPKSPPFRSKQDKETLGNMCSALRELFAANGGNGGGAGIYSKAADLANYWNAQRGYANSLNAPVDSAGLLTKSRAVADMANAMFEVLYAEKGIALSYSGHSDEFAALVDDGNKRRINALTVALEEFSVSMLALERASSQSKDPMLLAEIMNAGIPAMRSFVQATQDFQKWEFDTLQRIKALGETLSQ
jgi:hypothetical protein